MVSLSSLGIKAVDLLIADLGFSSNQMDDPARGLSFNSDGPLDMRLDPSLPQTAGDLVNTLPEQELADLIYQYGQERHSRKIARKIVEYSRSNHRSIHQRAWRDWSVGYTGERVTKASRIGENGSTRRRGPSWPFASR